MKGQESGNESEPVCVLMDEPELHLHPNLQGKVLDYIRNISVRENAQFVIATHSPTIVEYANSNELFLLRPPELVGGGENQLVRIASDDEKLQLLRDIFGSTSNITAMRPILVVEGKEEDRASKRANDSRIFAFLSEEFSRITIIPAGGKTECTKLAKTLNEALKAYSSQLRAFALLDRDVEDTEPVDPQITLLPVSMIENLLLDPNVLWQATELVHHKMTQKDAAETGRDLDHILSEMEDEEVARRLKAQIGPRLFRLQDPFDQAEAQVLAFSERLLAELSSQNIDEMERQCRLKVEKIKDSSTRRELFHGKKVLDEFYKRHLHDTGMSKEIFIYECARCASERKSVKSFVQALLASIGVEEVSNTGA